MFVVTSAFLSLRLILWPRIWSILVNCTMFTYILYFICGMFNKCQWIKLLHSSIPLLIFCLLVPTIIKKRLLKIGVWLYLSIFDSCFEALLRAAYVFRIDMSFWLIDLLYHYVLNFLIHVIKIVFALKSILFDNKTTLAFFLPVLLWCSFSGLCWGWGPRFCTC